ncbi:MAG: histidinol-phosphate transaminase [Oscillospiraceae bacterium]|nr:histidinol-phosphate transaminase [Oscillospiraceae bacterium]
MQYLSKKAASLTPYVAGLQPQEPGWVKLNTNENPYPPSPRVAEVLARADAARLRLYPDSDSTLLCNVLADRLNVPAENVFVGNGSDEVLGFAFGAFFGGKHGVMMPDISYGFYPVWAALFDVGVDVRPLSADFTINPDAYKDAAGVVIANPNAPTGVALTLAEIERIVQQNPGGVVLVDEAYLDFSDLECAVSLVPQYDNLLVVRTFSKSHSLAGLRVGYAVGHADLIDGLQRMKHSFNSYPLDMLAQLGAAASMADADYWEETRRRIIATRERTAEALRTLGYTVLPSQANFLFVRASDAKGLYEHLLAHKVLVRYWDKPRIRDFLRVTIGTDEEMEAFLQCVKQF